jgi:hypothetical protein
MKTKKELTLIAEEILMEKIALALGYFSENDACSGMNEQELEIIGNAMQKKADAIAKKFGYEKAWSA